MAQQNGPPPEPARILIVDDEPSVCLSIQKVLDRQGHQTQTALSASSALQILQASHDFDLIITDLMMPQVNGIELLKIVKGSWPEIPVLVITGYASITSAVESTRLGAANYLPKPFTPEELLTAVLQALSPTASQAIDGGDGNAAVAGEATLPSGADSDMPGGPWTEPPLSPDAPTILVVDNEIVVVNSVRRILTRKGYQVEAAFTGSEALQRIQGRSYTLVLMDMRLPDHDGLQLVSKMRNIKPEVPVVVVTGYASIDTAVEAIRRGAADYMAKPFTPEELLDGIARVLGRES